MYNYSKSIKQLKAHRKQSNIKTIWNCRFDYTFATIIVKDHTLQMNAFQYGMLFADKAQIKLLSDVTMYLSLLSIESK